jgi:hypothetical protein
LAVAIAARLTRAGVSVPIAAKAGMTFAHTAVGNPMRAAPGALYAGMATIILAAGDSVKIFGVGGNSDPLEMVTKVGDEDAAAFLFADPIVRRIQERLARAD